MAFGPAGESAVTKSMLSWTSDFDCNGKVFILLHDIVCDQKPIPYKILGSYFRSLKYVPAYVLV